MAYADDLIEQARHLAGLDPRRPKQANVRRAVSAAYYALFHDLSERVAGSILGGRDASGPVGERLRRLLDHKALDTAAKWFSGAGMPPPVLAMRPTRGPVALALVGVCRTFSELQRERHRADYDRVRPFSRAEAIRLISSAEAAIGILRGFDAEGDVLVFFLCCLFGESVRKNA